MANNLKFTYRDMSNYAEEYEIIAHSNGETFSVVRFVNRTDFYAKGLEKNYKVLVDMEHIAGSLVDLLNSLSDIGKLDGGYYDSAMAAYHPFIDKRLKYESFKTRINLTLQGSEWT